MAKYTAGSLPLPPPQVQSQGSHQPVSQGLFLPSASFLTQPLQAATPNMSDLVLQMNSLCQVASQCSVHQDVKTEFLRAGASSVSLMRLSHEVCTNLFFNLAFSLSIEISNFKTCCQLFVTKSSIITLTISLLTSGICQPLLCGGGVPKTLSVSGSVTSANERY